MRGAGIGVAVVVVASLVLTLGLADAQDAVRVQGRVGWIAGQTMVIVPDGNPSIDVDLSRVPQEQHSKLREGDRVAVTGALNNERTRLIAGSVERPTP
jgi:hypothetical protein